MRRESPKYIFVTGGVLSGVGKGIAAASIGVLLKSRGLKVSIQKCDPYLNVDAGTLSPAEHGECFVTADGAETDLDLGHYERFLDIETTRNSITLSGRLLKKLIDDERAGKFLGKTVQLVPHLTNAIQGAIIESGKDSDVHIVEVGGTVGDYEGLSFIEAIRGIGQKYPDRCAFIHTVYVPYLRASKEFKTKPSQNAIRDLRGFGISPDIIIARVEEDHQDGIAKKLSMFSGVDERGVIVLPNADTVFRVPIILHEKKVDRLMMDRLSLPGGRANIKPWQDLVARATKTPKQRINIGIIAKYLDNEDTYLSVLEALKAASWSEGVGVDYEWVDAEKLTKSNVKKLSRYNAIIIPGGFGIRGVEGKITAAQYALKHKLPYLGLCLGMQVAVIAAARISGLNKATSQELDANAKDRVIYVMDSQKGKEETGGTMRLGNYSARLKRGSLTSKVYGKSEVTERHRHRYEVNLSYQQDIENGGLIISGQSPDGSLVEFVEAPDHPFFIATQAHPEFKSRPLRPHPLFIGLVRAAKKTS